MTFAGTDGDRQLSGVAAGTADNDAVNLAQLNAVDTVAANSVQYDGADKARVTFGGAGGTVLANVKAGDLSETSTEAVNGSQLFATNTRVSANETAITDLTGSINSGTIGLVQQVGGTPGTGAITVAAATGGKVVTFAGTDGDRQLSGVAAGTADNDAVNFAQLKAIGNVALNSVQYDGADMARVTFGGANGTRLSNVMDGLLSATSTDAVNGRQLFATNTIVNNHTSVLGDHGKWLASLDTRLTNLEENAVKYDDFAGAIGGGGNATDNSGGASNAGNGAGGNTGGNGAGGGNGSGGAGNAATPPSLTVTLQGENGTRISNLADGEIAEGSRDAVNGGQLHAALQNIDAVSEDLASLASVAVTYDNSAKSSITLNAGGNAVVLGNVADGELSETSKQAVNGSQLFATNQNVANNTREIQRLDGQLTALSTSVDQRFMAVSEEMRSMRKDYNSGIASSIAISQIPQAVNPGSMLIGMGTGYRDGEMAVAFGLSGRGNDDRSTFKASLGYDSSKLAAGLGLGIEF